MSILITLFTLTIATFFLIGNFYNTMRLRAHERNKTIGSLQKELRAKKLKFESRENSLKNDIKEADRKLTELKNSTEREES